MGDNIRPDMSGVPFVGLPDLSWKRFEFEYLASG